MRFSHKAARIVATVLAVCCHLGFAWRLRAGMVVTMDGRTVEGEVKIGSQRSVVVIPGAGPVEHIELSEVFRATFGPARMAPPAESLLTRGVVLTDGTALAVQAIVKADAHEVRVRRSGVVSAGPQEDPPGRKGRSTAERSGELVLPTRSVARIVFNPTSAIQLARVPTGRQGVLLESGDFAEGQLVSIDGARVTISSTLFGRQAFDSAGQVLSVVLNQPIGIPRPEATTQRTGERASLARFVVRLNDGSVFRATRLAFTDVGSDRGGATARAELDGTDINSLSFEPRSLLELRASGPEIIKLEALAESRTGEAPGGAPPHGGAKPAGIFGPTTVEQPVRLRGIGPPERAITIRTDAPFDIALDGRFRGFHAACGVPAGVLPTRSVRMLVLVDDKEAFRSPPLTSVDTAVPVSLNLSGARRLSLRVVVDDGAAAISTGAIGAWVDPLLVSASVAEPGARGLVEDPHPATTVATRPAPGKP